MAAWDISGRPGMAVAALCAAQAAFWTLAPALSHQAPPLDVVEFVVWGREGMVATYKHPNLPGLVLEGARLLSGGAVWPFFLVSQVFVAGSFVAVYLLGRALLGPGRALAGTLLLTGVFYYSWPTPEMNHNVAQMPFWAGFCLSLWRASRGGGLVWWIALGVFAGLSLWAKYAACVLFAAALGWILWDAQARSRLATPGPWIALVLAVLIALPQLRFVIASDLLPVEYALARSSGVRGDGAHGFLLAQLADHGVFLVMAAVAGLFGFGAARRPPHEAAARRFLLAMGLGPVLLVAASAALLDMGVKDMWGAPMFNLSGLLALALFPGRFGDRGLRRLIGCAVVLLVAVPAAYGAAVAFRGQLSDRPSRAVWPQDAIARGLLRAYESEVGRPPGVIAGPVWEAGLIALRAPGRPSILIDGEVGKSPWLAGRDPARRGVLAVWSTEAGPPDGLKPLIATRPVGRRTFPWTRDGAARPIRLSYVVVPPRE